MTFFEGGESFIHKGTNGRWIGVLKEEQLQRYNALVQQKLTPECAAWLESGDRRGF
jgi:aryl sulfotransferase